jgi:glyoxylase-like metal-dependent hydrolase (beta-lactamase superfamily II)
MGTLMANLRRAGVSLGVIRYGVATHFHIDHAGLAEELKQAGVPLLVPPEQLAAIPLMKAHTKPQDGYVEIRTDDNQVVICEGSRALLARLGLAAEIVHTPGHSDDSVSVLLDSSAVFTGDLHRRRSSPMSRPLRSRRAGSDCGNAARDRCTRGTGRSCRCALRALAGLEPAAGRGYACSTVHFLTGAP